jgi:hypothetical protein
LKKKKNYHISIEGKSLVKDERDTNQIAQNSTDNEIIRFLTSLWAKLIREASSTKYTKIGKNLMYINFSGAYREVKNI